MANGLSKLNRKNHSFTKIVAAEIVALVLLACWMTHYFRFISSESARIIVSHSVPSARGVEFGGRFKLSGLKLSRRSDGLHIDAVWESLAVQKMTCGSVFTLQDSAGKKLSSQMFAQDNFARSVSKGTLWEDKIVLSPSTLTGAAKVELSLCDPFTGPVAISRGLQGTDPTQIVLAIP